MANKENIRKVNEMIYLLEEDIGFLERMHKEIEDYENDEKDSIHLTFGNVLMDQLLDKRDLDELLSIIKIKIAKTIYNKRKELDEIQAGVVFDDVVYNRIVNNS